MKYLVMIQARCGSLRLPNKVLKDLCGKPQLQRVIERAQRSRYVDEVMVVTSVEKSNLPIIKLCSSLGIRVGVGAEHDVLDRYYQTAKLLEPKYIIRITADCPCIDPGIMDAMILQVEKNPGLDYCSNMLVEDMADGLDVEIIKFHALEQAWREARHSFEREHVTQYIIRRPELFRLMDYTSPIGYFGKHRWTVDEPEDFLFVEKIYHHFLEEKKKEDFNYQDILEFLEQNPKLKEINRQFQRNEGLQKSMEEDQICAYEFRKV